MKKYILLICLAVYVAVMFTTSSLYHSVIMDPMQFLWAFLLFVAGPVMFVIALVLVVRRLLGKGMPAITVVAALLCLVLVPTWTFGFWAIGRACRPAIFSLVADANTAVADSGMKENPEGLQFSLNDFRYPFLRLPIPARARHQDGIFFITVPSGPGPKDTIEYDPQKKGDHSMQQHLAGAWWFSPYQGH
jgi:hypothetical protein